MKGRRPNYPFAPKTANWLTVGDFWALPLSDGTFGCGRVIQVPPADMGLGRMAFLAGVLDWHGAVVPSSESIAGAACLDQGRAHIRAITRTGGTILGFRELSKDGIEPWFFRGAEFWKNSQVYRGLSPERPQTTKDSHLPILSTWGYNVVRVIAESRYVKKSGR